MVTSRAHLATNSCCAARATTRISLLPSLHRHDGACVLREIGAEVVPSRLLLNKIDRVSEADRAALRAKHPDAILLSAKSPADVAALRKTIITFFEAAMVDDQIVLPYAKQGLLGDVYDHARVLSEDYDTTGRIMKVRGLPGAIARLRRTLAAA